VFRYPHSQSSISLYAPCASHLQCIYDIAEQLNKDGKLLEEWVAYKTEEAKEKLEREQKRAIAAGEVVPVVATPVVSSGIEGIAVTSPLVAGVGAAVTTAAGSEGKESGDGKRGDQPGAKPVRRKRLRTSGVSLAAKWAPTEGTAFDKDARLAKRIAQLMFPQLKQCFRAYRQVVNPLRKHLVILERLMCAGEWEAINFNHVPALAHHRTKKQFIKHQPERYAQYQRDLEEGKAKINTTGLQPHLLVEKYLEGTSQQDATIEAQWRTIVQDLRDSGNFGSTLAIVDVSGSMHGIPMVVAITLGLMVSGISLSHYSPIRADMILLV
jgi:hypothetical protein